MGRTNGSFEVVSAALKSAMFCTKRDGQLRYLVFGGALGVTTVSGREPAGAFVRISRVRGDAVQVVTLHGSTCDWPTGGLECVCAPEVADLAGVLRRDGDVFVGLWEEN